MRIFFLAFALTSLNIINCISQENYRWNNVAIGGGGYVTDIVVHPKERDLIYIRTDVGGLFKWDNKHGRWIQLLDWVGYDNVNYRNVDGVAIDPNNPDLIYIAAGNDVLKSNNRGLSWKNTGLNKEFMGNGDYRWVGENIAVDPLNSKIIYCGTRNDGLYCSTDTAKTWQPVRQIPSGKKDIGIRTIVFDSKSIKDGKCQKIYVGIPGFGIYWSNDAGNTFSILNGSPLDVNRMAIAADGSLIVTHQGGLSKFNGKWTDISPHKNMEFCGLAIDPNNTEHYVISESRNDCLNSFFQTNDAGKTWNEVRRKIHFETAPGWYTFDAEVAEGTKTHPDKFTYFAAAVSSLAFDPFTPNKLLFSDWYAVWWTNNINAPLTEWVSNEKGHEETVVLSVVCPTGGFPLFTLMADNCGFFHNNIHDFPTKRLTDKAEGINLDYCDDRPSNLVMIDAEDWAGKNTRLLVSTDAGKTFMPITKPEGTSGRVAYSSDDSLNIVYLPAKNKQIYFTEDMGKTWVPSKGSPIDVLDREYIFNYNQPLAADKVEGSTFYLFCRGKLYQSADKGKNWILTQGEIPQEEGDDWTETSTADPTTESGFVNLKTAPGLKGTIWISLGKNGLWRSSNGGEKFSPDTFFEAARCLAWGKEAATSLFPTAYVYGTHQNEWGLYRSTDMGKSWLKINDNEHSLTRPYSMDGDKNKFGRVYLSIGGRGVMYGETDTK